MYRKLFYLFFVLLFIFTLSACTRKSSEIDLNVHKVELDNGLTALLVKTKGAPVFSGYIRIKVGSIEEPEGSSGLAHFFEHMAFKGTPTIGTRDYEKEKVLLKQIEQVGQTLAEAKKAGNQANILNLQEQLKSLTEKHQQLIKQNEFVQIYQRHGGGDINATTSADFTSYFVSLPTSKLELWAYLESERLLHPVLREFYKERDVVYEERRLRYENTPDGRLYEAFIDFSFDHSPYGINVIGKPEDIQSYTFEAARKFRDKYYIPSRMVIAVAGNIDLKKTEELIRKYFGPLPKKEDSGKNFIQEPLTAGAFPRQKILSDTAEPRFYLGFHRLAHPHPDDLVLDAIESILCKGRTSRLFVNLVKEKNLVSDIACYASLPGSRLDSLFTFYAQPLPQSSNQDAFKEILVELERLKKEPVSSSELQKIKNQIDAELIWSLDSNMGLAGMLTFFESLTGNWKYLYEVRDKIHSLTAEDIQRVAQKYFVPERRSAVFLEKE